MPEVHLQMFPDTVKGKIADPPSEHIPFQNPVSCLIHPFNKKAPLFREDVELFLMKFGMNDGCVRG